MKCLPASGNLDEVCPSKYQQLSSNESKRPTLGLPNLNLQLRHCYCFSALPKGLTPIPAGMPSAPS
jgi:hypothetical protein